MSTRRWLMRFARWYVVEDIAGGWAGSEPIEADTWVITGRLTRRGALRTARQERRYSHHGRDVRVVRSTAWEGRPVR